MSAHALTEPPILDSPLSPPRDRDALRRWLEAQGYQGRAIRLRALDADRWGVEDDPDLALWRLGTHPRDDHFLILLAEWRQPPRGGHAHEPISLSAWLQRWAARLWRRDRSLRGLLIAAAPGYRELALALPFPDGLAERPGLRLLSWPAEGLCAVDRQRLTRLALGPDDDDAEALTARLAADLDLRHVSQGFFTSLRRARRVLAAELAARASAEDADEIALITLNRLIFIHFLQKKGLLDGDPRYLARRVEGLREARGGLWEALLAPLFFGALNSPPGARGEAAAALGEIPYLNGGLFEPTGAERRLGAALGFSDAALEEVLGELGRYALSTAEDSGAGLDPELLGRVFEALMAAQERSASGTFFTPRALVREMVRRGLEQLLLRAGAPESAIPALLEPGRAVPMPPALAASTLRRLDSAAVLDPACGSGAFLLEALAGLERLHGRLARLGAVRWPEGAALRRRIIARNLYGVDLSAPALRLCELRLWLSILDASPPGEPLAPLPNLDAHLVQGDALLEPLDWASVGADLGALEAALRDLEELKARYGGAHAADKVALRGRLHEAQRALMLTLLDRRRHRLQARLAHLLAAGASPDLLGAPQGLSAAAKREQGELRQELLTLRGQLARLQDAREAPAFSPWVSFAEVMGRGGFDLILMNPPWVRLHNVPAPTRERLKRRYTVLRAGAWTADGMLRALGGFLTQVDLSACFVERALELCADGGALCLLVPSKLSRALYGGGVRRLLMSQATPLWLREVEEGAFEGAITYPMALLARKAPPAPGAAALVSLGEDDPGRLLALWRLRLEATDLGSPWVLSALERDAPTGRCVGARLGDHPALEARRGVLTGHNEAFLCAARDPEARAHSLPLLRGADVRAWRQEPSDRVWWPHGRDGAAAPLPALPPTLEAALAPHQRALAARGGLRRRDPWWRLLRTGAHLLGPKVAWRDIGTRLEAVAIAEASVGEEPVVALNTVYFIPTRDRQEALALAAWMNSGPVRALAARLCERARGGHLRFFAWVIALLPLPPVLALALRDAEGWASALKASAALRELVALSDALHRARGATEAQQERLDALVMALYAHPEPRP